MNQLVLFPLLVPLLTVIATFATNRQPKAQRACALAGALGSVVVAGLVMSALSNGETLRVELGGWAAPIGIVAYADRASAGFIVFAALVHIATTVRELVSTRASRLYWPLLNGLVMGVQGAFITADIFNLYVWFEVLLLSSFVLVSLGNERNQSGAALRYAVINFLSSASFLLGIGLLYGSTGTLSLAELATLVREGSAPHLDAVAALFLVGFAIKAAVFPFSLWLPFAYSAPPASAAIPMAALLTKVGIYALLRTGVLVFEEVWWFSGALSVAAIASIAIGAIGMFAATALRAMASHTIVFASGFMLLGISQLNRAAVTGALCYAFADMLVVLVLFFFVAEVEHRSGAREVAELGGYYRAAPFTALVLGGVMLSVAGFPPFLGFWPKLILLRAVAESSWLLVGLALASSGLALVAVCRVWSRALWRDGEGTVAPRDSRTRAALGAVLAAVFFALSLYPEPLVGLARGGAEDLFDVERYREEVLRR